MRKEIMEWMKQGEYELKYAEEILKTSAYSVVAFLCQQATEKILKAFYIYKNQEIPPKTHSLIEIGKELKVPEKIMEVLRDLTSDYLVSRYPDAANGIPAEMYDKKMILEKLKNTKKVIKWIKKMIK